eukprot:3706734-Pleurochrysis_carterae.AAC.2
MCVFPTAYSAYFQRPNLHSREQARETLLAKVLSHRSSRRRKRTNTVVALVADFRRSSAA